MEHYRFPAKQTTRELLGIFLEDSGIPRQGRGDLITLLGPDDLETSIYRAVGWPLNRMISVERDGNVFDRQLTLKETGQLPIRLEHIDIADFSTLGEKQPQVAAINLDLSSPIVEGQEKLSTLSCLWDQPAIVSVNLSVGRDELTMCAANAASSTLRKILDQNGELFPLLVAEAARFSESPTRMAKRELLFWYYVILKLAEHRALVVRGLESEEEWRQKRQLIKPLFRSLRQGTISSEELKSIDTLAVGLYPKRICRVAYHSPASQTGRWPMRTWMIELHWTQSSHNLQSIDSIGQIVSQLLKDSPLWYINEKGKLVSTRKDRKTQQEKKYIEERIADLEERVLQLEQQLKNQEVHIDEAAAQAATLKPRDKSRHGHKPKTKAAGVPRPPRFLKRLGLDQPSKPGTKQGKDLTATERDACLRMYTELKRDGNIPPKEASRIAANHFGLEKPHSVVALAAHHSRKRNGH